MENDETKRLRTERRMNNKKINKLKERNAEITARLAYLKTISDRQIKMDI